MALFPCRRRRRHHRRFSQRIMEEGEGGKNCREKIDELTYLTTAGYLPYEIHIDGSHGFIGCLLGT